jgi:predicted DNA binding CopG/RHH family protein
MRKEYELDRLTVKRTGILSELAVDSLEKSKVRITISVDKDILDFLKQEAQKPGALPYQTQINQFLRNMLPGVHSESCLYEKIKSELLCDNHFMLSVAQQVQRKAT